MAATRSPWALSVSAVLLAAAFALALAPMANNDLWWHLATGRWMVEHHRLPVEDPFSFTAFMRPWHDVEWLSELVLYGVWRLAGERGLVLGAALDLTFIFGLVWWLGRLTSGSDLVASLLMVVAAVVSRYWWAPRPTLASDVLALLTLLILERYRRGLARWEIWALPALAALWANLHGGFVLAPVMVGTVAGAALLAPLVSSLAPEGFGSRERRHLLVVALLVPIALLVNANGASILSQSVQMFGASGYRFLNDEWTWPDWRFVVIAWLIVATLAVRARKRMRLSTLGLGFGLTALATSAHRFELYFGLLVLPILGDWIGPLELRRPPAWLSFKLSLRQAAILLAVVALAVAAFGRDRLRMKLDHYPVAAIEVLEAQRAERVFNLYSWGGWLLWTTDLPTFIDGRSWGAENFGDYIAATGGAYENVFRRDDIRWTLLPPDALVNLRLAQDPGWERVFADGQAVVFRRRTPVPP